MPPEESQRRSDRRRHTTCSAADGLIGIHNAFLPGFNQVPTPTVAVAAPGIQVGDSTTLTASGSGATATYNWNVVTGGGSVDPAGETVTFTASDTPETVTVSVFASVTGYQDSEAVTTDILVSDLPFLTAPTVTFEDGTSIVFINDTVDVSASGSGAGVTYNWSVDGSGSIAPAGATVAYSASATEETATISVYASGDGFNDSPVTQASVSVKANHFAVLASASSTSGANINAAAAALVWADPTPGTPIDAAYFATPSTTELEVLVDGDYFLALTIPMETAAERSAVRAEVRVNGTLFDGGVAESSYVRNNAGGHSESSDHLALLLDGLTAGDLISVFVIRAAIAGTVNITDTATLYVEYVEAARTVFSGTATQTTFGTDLNQDTPTPYALEWTATVGDAGYTHNDVVDPEFITLDAAGTYIAYVNIPLSMAAVSANRYNIEMHVQLDGTTVTGGQAQQGYIRKQDGHDHSSLHWSGIFQASAGDVLTVAARREPTMTSAGVVTVGGSATVFVERIDTATFVYAGRGVNTTAGIEWNNPPVPPTAPTQFVEWAADTVIDPVTYSHNTASQQQSVTLQRAGDYLVIYNDSLYYTGIVQGTDYRFNPAIALTLDGTPVAGAETKTHYLRNDTTGNKQSSASLVYYLEGVTAGQVLSLSTQQEATVSGVGFEVRSEDDALLTIIRKQ